MKNLFRVAFLLTLSATLWAQQPTYETVTATIPAGASTSAIIKPGACIPVAIATPAVWTSASIAISATVDGTRFLPVYDVYGTRLIIVVGTDRWVTLLPSETWSLTLKALKILSVDSSGNAVNQTVEAPVTIVCR